MTARRWSFGLVAIAAAGAVTAGAVQTGAAASLGITGGIAQTFLLDAPPYEPPCRPDEVPPGPPETPPGPQCRPDHAPGPPDGALPTGGGDGNGRPGSDQGPGDGQDRGKGQAPGRGGGQASAQEQATSAPPVDTTVEQGAPAERTAAGPSAAGPTTQGPAPTPQGPAPTPQGPGPSGQEPAATGQPGPGPAASDPPYHVDCAAAREAGAAPLTVEDPGYRPELDPDGDGVACDAPPRAP